MLDILDAVKSWPADLAEEWLERAAIIEEGCKVSRAEAERMAFEMLKPRIGDTRNDSCIVTRKP